MCRVITRARRVVDVEQVRTTKNRSSAGVIMTLGVCVFDGMHAKAGERKIKYLALSRHRRELYITQEKKIVAPTLFEGVEGGRLTLGA